MNTAGKPLFIIFCTCFTVLRTSGAKHRVLDSFCSVLFWQIKSQFTVVTIYHQHRISQSNLQKQILQSCLNLISALFNSISAPLPSSLNWQIEIFAQCLFILQINSHNFWCLPADGPMKQQQQHRQKEKRRRRLRWAKEEEKIEKICTIKLDMDNCYCCCCWNNFT